MLAVWNYVRGTILSNEFALSKTHPWSQDTLPSSTNGHAPTGTRWGKRRESSENSILILLQPSLSTRRVKAWHSFLVPLCLSTYHRRCHPLAGTSPGWRDPYTECAGRSRGYTTKPRRSTHHIAGRNSAHTNDAPQQLSGQQEQTT